MKKICHAKIYAWVPFLQIYNPFHLIQILSSFTLIMTKILILVTLLISNFFIKIVYTIEDNVCHSGSEEDCNISIFDYQDEMDWKNNFEELWDWLNFVKNSDQALKCDREETSNIMQGQPSQTEFYI